jgi:hypothetical protein
VRLRVEGRPLSADQRAVIGRIPIPTLRAAAARLWRVKVHPQSNGWLRYISPALVAFVFLAIAGLAQLLGLRLLATLALASVE